MIWLARNSHISLQESGYFVVLLLSVLAPPYLTSNFPHRTGTYLNGPVNQSVQIGKNVRFPCRIENRMRLGSSGEKWDHLSTQKQLHVQWIIDGFGVTNETLKSVHAERYQMPGPSNEGIYDLIISNVQLEDEASFICQANVKFYRNAKPPLIETLTSQPVYLTVVVPPNGLLLRKSAQTTQIHDITYTKANPTNDARITIAWNNFTKFNSFTIANAPSSRDGPASSNRTVADDPRMIDSSGSSHDASALDRLIIKNNSNVMEADLLERRSMEQLKSNVPVIWIPENEQLTLECQTGPSKPVSQIVWVLAGSYLRPTNQSKRYDSLAWNNPGLADVLFDVQHSTPSQEKFEIVNREIDDQSFNHDPLFVDENSNQTENVMKVTVSLLRLIVQRHHERQLVQCKISNADEFMVKDLPVVAAIIEPLYVDKIQIEPITTSMESLELREGTDVDYRCTAKTNPNYPIFRWMFIRKDWNKGALVGNQSNSLDTDDHPQSTLMDSASSGRTSVRLRLQRDMHGGRIVCWVGVRNPDAPEALEQRIDRFGQYGQFDGQMMWRKTERELNILYGATFEHLSDNLRATSLGQMITLDCSVDANPMAQISLYRLGDKGRQFLNELSAFHMRWNRSLSKLNGRELTERNQLSTSDLAKAIKSEGSQILTVANQKISYPLKVQRPDDFGFYICVARNTGFPPALRHVLVGETSPPRIIQCGQIEERKGLAVELVCFVHSIPRPNKEQIIWTRKGHLVKSNDRLHIYDEPLIRGTRSALHFRRLASTDIAQYNFTVFNEYGADWQLVNLSNEASLPLVFVIGSGAATGLALMFVIIIGCFIRRSRSRATEFANVKQNGLDMTTASTVPTTTMAHSLNDQNGSLDLEMRGLTSSVKCPLAVSTEQHVSQVRSKDRLFYAMTLTILFLMTSIEKV